MVGTKSNSSNILFKAQRKIGGFSVVRAPRYEGKVEGGEVCAPTPGSVQKLCDVRARCRVHTERVARTSFEMQLAEAKHKIRKIQIETNIESLCN